MQCSADCSIENPSMTSSCPDKGWYVAKYDPARSAWIPHAGSADHCEPGYRPVPMISGPGTTGVCKIFCCELDPGSSSSSSSGGAKGAKAS